jgi:sugar transferase (PEP-CTERM/EpsH1 system associated)
MEIDRVIAIRSMKILIVSSAIPFPPLGGGQLRTYHLTRALAAVHDVTLAGFTFEAREQSEVDRSAHSVRVVVVPWTWPRLYRQMTGVDESAAVSATEVLADDRHEPWFVSFYESPRMEEELRTLAEEGFDLVVFEGTDMARFLPLFNHSCAKILDFMDVHSQMELRATASKVGDERIRARREADRTLRFERQMARQCALCLTCSEAEAAAARTLLEVERVAIVPNGVDTRYFRPMDGPRNENPTIVFTGMMNYPPNIEAVEHFTGNILPLVGDALPDVKFHIVGANPAPEVKSLASERIVVHGGVEDMRPYLAAAEVVVVPILSGGGTRLKVLEAAASGKAIVSTSLGAEGLEFNSPQDLIVADSAQAFADAVIAVVTDEPMRRQLQLNARQASLAYDWQKIGRRLMSTLGAMAAG